MLGCVIGVFSAKGGVGKSLLATNLGVSLSTHQKRRTVMIDLTPGMGTADLLLDLEPERSWADLLPVVDELTSQHLRLAVTGYRQSLDFLACPSAIREGRIIKKEDVKSILAAFREEYEVVLLDTFPGGGDINKAAFTLSDICLVVLTPDAPALRATSRFLTAMPKNEKMTALVINQYSPGAALRPEEIAGHLQEKLLGTLPVDPSGIWSNVSYGQPCVSQKHSTWGKSVRQLSTVLMRVMDQ